MTQEEKARKYDKAIERAEGLIDFCSDSELKTLEYVFPELKESEDERIRKAIIESLPKYGYLPQTSIKVEDAIAWLEKQGGQEEPQVYKTENGEVITYSESEGYKAVEPKFKVGDYIKHNKANIICKIISVNSGSYYVENIETNGGIELFNAEQNFHLWTIEDAKDGDILSNGNSIIIFKGIGNERWNDVINYHIGLLADSQHFVVQKNLSHWGNINEVTAHPATKEQRDLLFKKMKEYGYEWNADKKELKKIEQKSAWSEEDEKTLNTTISFLSEYAAKGYENAVMCIDWLKSLKERIKQL